METKKEEVAEHKDQNSPKKSGKKKLFFIFLILLIVIFSSSLVFIISNPSGNPAASLLNKNVLKTKAPKLIDSQRVTKKISSATGGTISVKGKNGIYYTLNIPPGSLKQDTDISLTPLDEIPIEGFNSQPDPGVLIGPAGVTFNPPGQVNIGNNPPLGNGGNPPGGMPGGNPPGGVPEGNPTVEVPGGGLPGGNPTGGNPPGGNPPNVITPGSISPAGGDLGVTRTPGNSGGDDSGGDGSTPGGMSVDVSKFTQIAMQGGNIDMNSILKTFGGSSQPPGAAPGSSIGDTRSVITPTPVPSQFDPGTVIIVVRGGGNIHLPPAKKESDGSESVPVDESGTVSPNSPDHNNAVALANQAGAQGCTDDFMTAAAQLVKKGDNLSGINLGILERCKNERLNQLEDTCKTDRMLLRRKEFQNLITIMDAIHDKESVKKATDLMNTCTSMMKFEVHQSELAPDNDATFYMDFTANVCGYIDDPWTGDYKGGSQGDNWFAYTGKGEFSIPGQGGQWVGTFPMVFTSEAGLSMTFPFSEATGTFDGRREIKMKSTIHSNIMLDTPIILENLSTCIPAAPLPAPPGNSQSTKPNTSQNSNKSNNTNVQPPKQNSSGTNSNAGNNAASAPNANNGNNNSSFFQSPDLGPNDNFDAVNRKAEEVMREHAEGRD